MKKIKPVVAWAPVEGGRIMFWPCTGSRSDGEFVECYRTRRDSENRFGGLIYIDDVIRVRITPIHPRKKRKRK